MTSSSGWFSIAPSPLVLISGSISTPSWLLPNRSFLWKNGGSPPNHTNYYNQKRTEDIGIWLSKSSKYFGIEFNSCQKEGQSKNTISIVASSKIYTNLLTGFTTMQIWWTDGKLLYDLKLLVTMGFQEHNNACMFARLSIILTMNWIRTLQSTSSVISLITVRKAGLTFIELTEEFT